MGRNKLRKTTEQFCQEVLGQRGPRWDTSKVVYETSKKKVTIICPEGHEFQMTPNAFLSHKQGCPICKKLRESGTQEQFIEEAKIKHPENRYDYSLVRYVNKNVPVEIKCSVCGEVFKQRPYIHLRGSGCPECGKKKPDTLEQVLEKFHKAHPEGGYDYSLVVYVDNKTKVKIKCIKHDYVFEMAPRDHIAGQGCAKCSKNYRRTQSDFELESSARHPGKYGYWNSHFARMKEPVEIYCFECEEYFWQTPELHIARGHGCPRCGGTHRLTTEQIITRFEAAHGYYFDYSKVVYTNKATPVTIGCPTHGWYDQLPMVHAKGHGCSKCSGKLSYTTETYKEEVIRVYGDIFDLSLVKYINSQTPVTIMCKKHGPFQIKASSFICKKNGCALCNLEKRFDNEVFISSCEEQHGDHYDLSQIKFQGMSKKIHVICPEHGSFYPIAGNFLRGTQCPLCACSFRTAEYIAEQGTIVHNGKYDYSLVKRVYGEETKTIDIICPDHGVFTQNISDHLLGRGCWRCACSGGYGKPSRGIDGVLYKSTLESKVADSLFFMEQEGVIEKYQYEEKTGFGRTSCDFLIYCNRTDPLWLEVDGMGDLRPKEFQYRKINDLGEIEYSDKISYYIENNFNYDVVTKVSQVEKVIDHNISTNGGTSLWQMDQLDA